MIQRLCIIPFYHLKPEVIPANGNEQLSSFSTAESFLFTIIGGYL